MSTEAIVSIALMILGAFGVAITYTKWFKSKIPDLPKYKSDAIFISLPQQDEYSKLASQIAELREVFPFPDDADPALLSTTPESCIAEMIKYCKQIDFQSQLKAEQDDPYSYWPQCDVEGCEGVTCSQGRCWRESGYWCVCSKHSQAYRDGKPQPKMKQSAIDKEASRDESGCLPSKLLKE